jgi:hypothetical protein
MHNVPGRINVVIIVAAVGERWASLRYKADKRRGDQIAHLILLFEAALSHRRPDDRWLGLARQFTPEAEIRVDHHSRCGVWPASFAGNFAQDRIDQRAQPSRHKLALDYFAA